jgi:OPA family glycerol-3-phosphate transporter-like MFS transporter
MPEWLNELLPIIILLVVVAIVISRLPKVEGLDYTQAFRFRRVRNWLPMGLLYAFLYMGRYNLKASQRAFNEIANSMGDALMGNAEFSTIFGIGTAVYGFAFIINGPLTDRIGGKAAMLIGAAGALLMNFLMGLSTIFVTGQSEAGVMIGNNFVTILSILYAVNMYFQSFGAVAIVKVNAPWFNVRERGVFGAIFGILISLGIYFAFDWSYFILDHFSIEWVFFAPTVLLFIFWILVFLLVKNTPAEAGHPKLDTGDATSGDDSPRLPAVQVFKKMLKNPIIMTIACIEFCSGFLRQAIMQWFPTFAKQTNETLLLDSSFVRENWGMLLCCAGIMGGVFAGVISDRVFQSRRGPVAGILYLMMAIGAIFMTFSYQSMMIGGTVIAMSLFVIGVHGMLSGTASMDFGGAKNAGTAVGIIDGFVYMGTATMALTYGIVLPEAQPGPDNQLVGPATDPNNWISWPIAMIPIAVIGFFLALRIWNAKPKPKSN